MLITRTFQAALAVALLAGSINPTFAQQQGGTAPGGGGAGGGGASPGGPTGPGGGPTGPGGVTGPTSPTGPTRPGQSTTTSPTQQQQSPFEMQRPIFFSGRVMMDDGTPPPDNVQIVMVCAGQPRPQAYTDNKGRFSFSPGQNQALFADASIGSAGEATGFGGARPGLSNPTGSFGRGVSERDLMSCELRADLPGYRSDIVNLAGRRSLDNPDVGTIVLHRLANVEGFTYSMTTANAPKEAKKAYDKGVEQFKKNKYLEAEAQLQKAVDLYPKYAIGWYELGRTQLAQKKNDEAKNSFVQSVEADSKFVNPHLQLLQLSIASKDWQQIADASDRVLKLNPFSYPQAWFLNGVANYNLGKKDAAEKSAREAFKLDPGQRNPKISHLLGVILAEKGDYAGALDQFRNYLNFAPQGTDADTIRKQIGELERLAGPKPVAQVPTPEDKK